MIVGAGLVGATAATLLARHGLKVALLERRAAPVAGALDTDVRALVLAPASVQVLEQAGLWSAIAPQAETIETIHVQERGRYGALRMTAGEAGLDALGWACPADGLLQTLVTGAQQTPGVVLSWATRYVSHRLGDEQMLVSAVRNGVTETFSARLLVAADGAESDVRGAAGIGAGVFDYTQDAIVANVAVSAPQPHTAFERFTSRGPLAMIPRGDARYVAVQCLDQACAERACALSDSEYLALLARRFGTRLGALSDLGPRRRHALKRRQAAAITAPHLVLVGNAANTVHPNAAQGLNLGLRDAAALARVLESGADPGAVETLSRYQALRQRDHANTVGFTDALAQAFRSPLGLVGCARRTALAAAACLPPLRHRLIVEASGLAALARMRDR